MVLLRDAEAGSDEIWCRMDCGPHGFLATAAHAHADALSFELRLGGVPVLVDPGTYCYHGERAWRDYFRSTLAHNALTLGGRDQAHSAGPFLWRTRADARLADARGLDAGDVAEAAGWHDGYVRPLRTVHRRRLILDRRSRVLEVVDWTEGPDELGAQLAFHLHPEVACRLAGREAHLAWPAATARTATATGVGQCGAVLTLPSELAWTTHRGETDPIRGWYSAGFGRKSPTTMLLGTGRLAPGARLRTRLNLAPQAREAGLAA
jgi:hypothetical protein